ncbi:Free methionine-R-sulfoxide reductase [Lachnellula arida]|uniref:DNA-directed RNA polymerase I subunit RPA43 n=1 Tax=Lachnellula arida TaxID=1316785 RepID=A0A8T9BLE2_9HELO|nr:Free methionine-R-sulfoxide reductase [Lachnellula arida]
MSIATPTSAMGSEKHKSKSEKKHKSTTHGEKKRKRDHKEDGGHKSKSKKHKSDKPTTASILEVPENVSPFHMQTSSLFLPLAPVSQKTPLEGLCAEHLSPLILTYYPPLAGVLLSYHNVRLSEKPFGNDGEEDVFLQNIDEYAVSWAWVTAEFLLFKPEKGAWLEGYVNLSNEGHLGIVCWNLFNASIERKRLPSDWKWVGVQEREEGDGEEEVYAEEGAGHYVDGEGKKVEGMVKFRVREIESSHDRERGFLSIEGTMLSEDAEHEMVESESGVVANRDHAGRRLGGSRALGATSLAVHAEASNFASDVTKEEAYKQVLTQATALLDGQRNWVCNLANTSSLLWHAYKSLPAPSASVNWAGFYVLDKSRADQLILGPFQGKVACQTIAFGKGVCGAAASKRETLLIHDVEAFPGHIACDGDSKSEIVVPIVVGGQTVAIIDVDCAEVEGFDEVDRRALEELARLLEGACDW